MTALLAAVRPTVGFHSHPDVIVVTLAIATFLWWAFTRLGPRVVEPGETVATYRNIRWAVIGVGLVFVFSTPLRWLSFNAWGDFPRGGRDWNRSVTPTLQAGSTATIGQEFMTIAQASLDYCSPIPRLISGE